MSDRLQHDFVERAIAYGGRSASSRPGGSSGASLTFVGWAV
ncbi:hypothetical protein [Scytonema sp. PRP1]